jgi:hypothetical protein
MNGIFLTMLIVSKFLILSKKTKKSKKKEIHVLDLAIFGFDDPYDLYNIENEGFVLMMSRLLEYADKLGLQMSLPDKLGYQEFFITPDVRSVCEKWEQMNDEVKELAFDIYLKELYDVFYMKMDLVLDLDLDRPTMEFSVEQQAPLTERNNHFDFVKFDLYGTYIFEGPFVLFSYWFVNLVRNHGMDIIRDDYYDPPDVNYVVLHESKYNTTYEMTSTIVQGAMEIVVKAHAHLYDSEDSNGIERPVWCEVKATMGGTTVTHYRGTKR